MMAQDLFIPVCVEYNTNWNELPDIIVHWGTTDPHDFVNDDAIIVVDENDWCSYIQSRGYEIYTTYFTKGNINYNDRLCFLLKLEYFEFESGNYWDTALSAEQTGEDGAIKSVAFCHNEKLGIFKNYHEDNKPVDGDTVSYHLHFSPSEIKSATKR